MMPRVILGVLCLSACHILCSCLRHYHFVDKAMTWTEAQSYCRGKYTDLATIDSAEEMKKFIETVSSSGKNSKVWIGLYSKIEWKWSDDYNGDGAEYRNWVNSEPDFLYNTRELCVCTGRVGDAWWDDACNLVYPVICNSGTQLRPKFVYVNQNLDWASGQKYCRDNYFDLATVNNSLDNDKIKAMVPNGWAWIGLFREPNIYWSDGSDFSYQNWLAGSKPLGSESLVCGVADLGTSGNWRFSPCKTSLPFVCHSPSTPNARQIVKLRIEAEDSTLDLNDAAVKAEILNKLKAKLVSSGVTVKWREQPDGKVFHKEQRQECPRHEDQNQCPKIV